LAELSPITQVTASMMFDLPQPLGPTMPTRFPGTTRVVGSTKDLNPASLILRNRMSPYDTHNPLPVQAFLRAREAFSSRL
jgi:hypothetical protein